MPELAYIAIDLKSFYASVELVERCLDPLTTHLVVADPSRTEKTICLAVSPALKAYGIPGRARLFEVVQKVQEINEQRRRQAPGGVFSGVSSDAQVLKESPELALDYMVAPPRMGLYMDYSARIYSIYLQFVAPEDIHVYSIDEVFMDVSQYLKTYGMTARELAVRMIREVVQATGITATAGIGTNLYLSKIAMDIVAKHMEPDEDGVRVAQLDELSYRQLLWSHRPLTDFWRIGRGYRRKLEQYGMYTMGDVARCSLGRADEYYNEDLLYHLFGVNAELLIDHAWGWEPCTMADIKAYRPRSNSLGSGQVLQQPYDFEKGRLIVREMTDLLALELVDRHLVTDQLVLTIGYDRLNVTEGLVKEPEEIRMDHYGRQVPRHAHGTVNLERQTSSTRLIMDAMMGLYDRIVKRHLLIRRVYLTANHVTDERSVVLKEAYEQLDLFTDYAALQEKQMREQEEFEREKRLQRAVLSIKKRYGKNAILKGMNLEEGAMTMKRNGQIGGHKA